MKNYQTHNIGKFSDLSEYVFAPDALPIRLEGKVFLRDLIGLTSMEVSINQDKPGTGIDFFHRHRNNEELYIFIGGKGEMMIDDERFAVEEGTVVRVPPEAKRAWWNTGDDDLYYVVVQAQKDGLITPAAEDGEILEETVPWGQ